MKEKVKELKIHEKDTGSSEVQIAQLTGKIESLSKHIKQFKKDKHSSVGLLRAVNRRKKLLEYLKKNNMESYKAVLTKLNLRKKYYLKKLIDLKVFYFGSMLQVLVNLILFFL